jgi:lysophospholipase L1-like esterase
MPDYILQEDGSRILLEDGSGSVLRDFIVEQVYIDASFNAGITNLVLGVTPTGGGVTNPSGRVQLATGTTAGYSTASKVSRVFSNDNSTATTYTDAVYEFDIIMPTAEGYPTFCFRQVSSDISNGNNGYTLLLGSNVAAGIQIDRGVNFTYTAIGNGTQTWVAGTPYRIKVVLRGAIIQVYVDGVLKVDISDGTYLSGYSGWLINPGGGTVSAPFQFDNLRVTNGGEPAQTGYSGTGLLSGAGQAGGTGTARHTAAGAGALSGSGSLTAQGGDPLLQWRTARTAGTSTILAIGDSLTEGQGAPTRAGRWLDRLRDASRGAAAGGINYQPSHYYTYSPDSTWFRPGVATGTILYSPWAGNLGGRVAELSVGATLTYTVTGTSVDIWHTTNGGTLTYQVDSGAAVSVNTAGTYQPNARITGVSLGAAGQHTVRITATAGTVYFGGLTVYDGDETTGTRVFEAGHSGWTAANHMQDTQFQKVAWGLVAPDLAIVTLGLNDAKSITAAAFKTNLQTIIAALKALPKVPSILLVASYAPDQGAMGYSAATWQTYVTAMKELAASEGTAVLDLSATMPPATTSGTGFYSADGIHPNTSGHTQIATLVGSALGVAAVEAKSGTGLLSGAGAVAGSGSPRIVDPEGLTGAGTLAGSGRAATATSGALSGSGALSAAGSPRPAGTGSLAGSGALTATGTVPLAALVDDFNDGAIDTRGGYTFGTIAETGGRLRASAALETASGWVSGPQYDLRNSALSAQMYRPTGTTAGGATEMQIFPASGDGATRFIVAVERSGFLTAQVQVGYAETGVDGGSQTVQVPDGTYARIRHTAPTVYFEYHNGTAWVTFRTVTTVPAWVTDGGGHRAQLAASGYGGAVGGPVVSEFDNLNIAPPVLQNFAGTGVLSGAGTVAAAGVARPAGAGVLVGGGAVTGAGVARPAGAGVLSGAGSLAGSGVATQTTGGAGLLSGAGAVAGLSTVAAAGSGVLSGAGAVTATGRPAVQRPGSLSGAGAVTGATAPQITGAGVLSGAGALSATGAPSTSDAGALSGDGTLTGAGSGAQNGAGAGLLTGSGALTATGTPRAAAAGTLAGAGTLSASALLAVTRQGFLAGAGAVAGAGVATAAAAGSGTLAGSGQVAGVGAATVALTGALSGAGALSSAGGGTAPGAGALAGTGALTATSRPAYTTPGALSGSGAVAGSGTASSASGGTGALSGAGALTATTTLATAQPGSLLGSGSLAGAGAATQAGGSTGALSGAGALTAITTPRPAAPGALSGVGALSTSSAVAVSPLAALSGAGAVTGSGVASSAAAGAGVLSGSGTGAGAGVPAVAGAGALSGAGALTTAGGGTAPGSGTLTGAGTLTTASTITTSRAGVLAGAGTLAAAGGVHVPNVGQLAGTGALAAGGQTALSGGGFLSGAGVLASTSSARVAGAAALSGAGVLSSAGGGTQVSAGAGALSGLGAVSAFATPTPAASGALTGAGVLTGATGPVRVTAGSLTSGIGVLAAAVTTATKGAGTLTGLGALTAAGGQGQRATALLTGAGLLTGVGVAYLLPPEAVLTRAYLTRGTTATLTADRTATVTRPAPAILDRGTTALLTRGVTATLGDADG